MIRRPSYKQFLNVTSNLHSSVNLSATDPHSNRLAPHDLSPNYITSKPQPDRAWQNAFLDVVKHIPNDPRTLRHTCASHTDNTLNLNSSFSNGPTASLKKADQPMIPKQSRPMSSFRPSSRQDPTKLPSGFSSKLQLSTCLASKAQGPCQPAEIEGKTLYQSKSSAKLAKRGEGQLQREIERLKELRSKRMQNNTDIMYRFEDRFKTEVVEHVPRSAVNLPHHNKENKVGESSNDPDLSLTSKHKSGLPARPVSAQPDISIFTPIQFRKKSSNNAHAENRVLVEPLSKSPIKRQSALTTTTTKPQLPLFSAFHICETPKAQRQSQKKVQLSDFAFGKKLGEGRFGSVNVAVHRATGSVFAMKKIAKSTIRQNFLIEQFILQVKIQLFIEHAYVVRLFGLFDDEESIYLLLEYLEGGTLYGQLKRTNRGRMSESETSNSMGMICEAVHCLHQKGIAHRDIKPENIIITNNICKLADFGWATLCDERRKTYCGTTDYVAPQIVEGLEYDISVDLWCVGVLAYELLAGRAPFYHISRQETFNKIKNVDTATLTYPQHFSQEATDFIGRLVKKNPNERMEMAEAVSHPFITKYHL